MKPLWRTPDGLLLAPRAPQFLPYVEGEARDRVAASHEHDLIDPTTGAIRKRWRRDCALDPAGGYRWSHHLVEDGALVEVLVHVGASAAITPAPARVVGETVLLAGLVPYVGPRWRTPDGHLLVEGVPFDREHGSRPCELVDGAHDYDLVDGETGAILAEYRGGDVVIGASDREVLTRYVVQDGALVEIVFDYSEDSCWGVGRIDGERRATVLTGLVAVPAPDPSAPA